MTQISLISYHAQTGYWGALVGRLERADRPLTAIDSLVAAIALEGEYTLVTRNEGDFTSTGVAVFNPWE